MLQYRARRYHGVARQGHGAGCGGAAVDEDCREGGIQLQRLIQRLPDSDQANAHMAAAWKLSCSGMTTCSPARAITYSAKTPSVGCEGLQPWMTPNTRSPTRKGFVTAGADGFYDPCVVAAYCYAGAAAEGDFPVGGIEAYADGIHEDGVVPEGRDGAMTVIARTMVVIVIMVRGSNKREFKLLRWELG
ncbi:hypothetical protein ACMYSQ_005592 [Aspergillus niger]